MLAKKAFQGFIRDQFSRMSVRGNGAGVLL
jgi:hypothetical protein